MFPVHRDRTFFLAAVLAVALAVVLTTAGVRAARGDDDQQIETFLSRLGLVDLQIVHLENTLDGQPSATAREQTALRLADLYAARLIDTADDQARYDDLVKRIEALKAYLPPGDTPPALEVMLLQADYKRAEGLITRWLDDPLQSDSRRQAHDVLERISPRLNRLQRELRDKFDKSLDQIDRIEDEDQLAIKQQELGRLNAVAGRAAYFAGWANYYFGISQQDAPSARDQFAKARATFRRLLGIDDDEAYDDVNVEWLQLESIHRAQAVVGLGLTEAALGELEASRACFGWLAASSAPPSVRDLAPYWLVRGLLNVGRLGDAADVAQRQIEQFSGGATQGKVSFCSLLVKTGFAGGDDTPAKARRLGELGIRGLVRLRQFAVIGQLMAKYNIEPPSDGGFYFRWLAGRQQFFQAEKTRSQDDYRAAVDSLSEALQDPQAGDDVGAAGQCRYSLAWCYYRLGELESAARQFERAASALAGSGAESALEATWMTFVVYERLSKKEARYTASAIEALQSIKRNFPDSPQAGKANFYMAKLQQSAASPEESIRRLEQIKPGDPNYLSALYDICLLRHQQWSTAAKEDRSAIEAAALLKAAVDRYLSAARRDEGDQRKLKCALLVVETAQRAAPPNWDDVKSYLATAQPFIRSLPPSHFAVQEYHYRHLQLARAAGDVPGTAQHARHLAEHAAGSVYELPAVITLAREADAAVDVAQRTRRGALLAEAGKWYARLVQLLGDSPGQLESNKNALVASSKLAYYQYEMGQYEQAAGQLEKILAVRGNHQDYLRRAALAHYRAGAYQKSLPHWMTLLSGLPANSEAWFEAKYYQIACLQQLDRSKAAATFQQFKSLYPLVKSTAWREKFQQLQSEFGE